MSHIVVEARDIGPVTLDCHDIEPVPLDESPRDLRPGRIEFMRPVRGLAEQHDPRVAEAVEGVPEFERIRARQCLHVRAQRFRKGARWSNG